MISKYAIYAAIGFAVLAGLQTLRLASEQAAHAQTREAHQALVAEAERAMREAVEVARTEEQRRYAALQEVANETGSALQAARADADAAAAVGRRLQERLATVVRAASSCARNSYTPGEREAADTAARVFADVQRRLDEHAERVAQFADAAHVAGLACERSYDAVRGSR